MTDPYPPSRYGSGMPGDASDIDPAAPAVPPPPGPVVPPPPGPVVETTDELPPPSDQGGDSTADQAKDAAKSVAGDAREAGRSVAETAKDEAASVKDDTVRQGRKLLDETSSSLNSHASDQLNRAGGALRSLSDDLGRVAEGESPDQGLVTELAGQINERTEAAAQWLENHEPGDVLEEVKSFARRRPLAFLGIAAGIGLVAGRLTRSVVDNRTQDDDQGAGDRATHANALNAPTGLPVDRSPDAAYGYGDAAAPPVSPRPDIRAVADQPVAWNEIPDPRGGRL